MGPEMSFAPALLHSTCNFLSSFIFDNLTFSLYLPISVPCDLLCDCQPLVHVSKPSLIHADIVPALPIASIAVNDKDHKHWLHRAFCFQIGLPPSTSDQGTESSRMFIILQHRFIGVKLLLNPDVDPLTKVFSSLFVIQKAWDWEQYVHFVIGLCARGKSHWQSASKKKELLAGPGAGRRSSVQFGLQSLGGVCTHSVLRLVFYCFLSPSPKAYVFCTFYLGSLNKWKVLSL